jgi:tyrosine-protein phosphatase SIW14
MSTKEEDSTTTQQQRNQTNSTTITPTTAVTVTSKTTTFISSNLAFKRTQSWSTASSSGEEFQQYEEELIPPNNFNMVSNWVYRSSFPKKKNFAFLKKLGLKSILTLILEEYPEQNMKFLEANNIKFFQFEIAGNKEPFVQSKIILDLYL